MESYEPEAAFGFWIGQTIQAFCASFPPGQTWHYNKSCIELWNMWFNSGMTLTMLLLQDVKHYVSEFLYFLKKKKQRNTTKQNNSWPV